jgi:hypothetical protein
VPLSEPTMRPNPKVYYVQHEILEHGEMKARHPL